MGTSLVLACGGDGPSDPTAGEQGVMEVILLGLASDDRAVLLSVGPGATSVAAGRPDLEVHKDLPQGGGLVAVFGSLAGQPILRIGYSDRNALPAISVREVARDDGSLRPDPTLYEVVTRPE